MVSVGEEVIRFRLRVKILQGDSGSRRHIGRGLEEGEDVVNQFVGQLEERCRLGLEFVDGCL